MEELKKIEIVRNEDGSVSLIVNDKKVETKDTIGIHIDVKSDGDFSFIELTRVERTAMLNFGKKLDCV